MTSTRTLTARRLWLISVVAITGLALLLALAVSNRASAAGPVTLVDNSTHGFYNSNLGTVLDATQSQFPCANGSCGDPTTNPASEPNLTFAAGTLGNWLFPDPFPLNANWSGLQSIPSTWTVNTETAIIYHIPGGLGGIANVKGNFGVDNGIFVWVNGIYKFGALAPGGAPASEYPNINLGDLPPGPNFIQILREDHGGGTGYAVNITGTPDQPPTCLGPVLISTPEDTAVTRDLRTSCSDPDVGDTIAIEIVSLSLTSVSPVPAIGSFPHTLPGGSITLNPAANFNGNGGTIQFRARDNKGAPSNIVTANVTVHPVNDAPVVTAPADVTLTEGTSTSFGLGPFVDDFETPDVSIQWAALSDNPAVAVVPGPNLFILAGEGPATANVTITATDRGDPNFCPGGPPGCSVPLSASASFTVTVVVPTTPDFSTDVQPPPDSCICTPLVMNTVNTGIEHWWAKADASGTLRLTVVAHSVNPTDAETVLARIFPASGVGPALASISASYPGGTAPGTEFSATGSVYPTTPGAIYLIRVSTPVSTPRQPHYRLKFNGATQAAVKSPTFRSFEPHANVSWFFPLGASPETLDIRIFNDGTPIPAAPPVPGGIDPLTVDVQIFGPGGVLLADPPALNFPNPPGTFDTTVSAAVPAGPGFAVLRVQSINTHYRLERTSGADRAVYLNWATFGTGTITGSIVNGGGVPFTGSVQVNLKHYPSGANVATQTTSTGFFTFTNVRVGRYIVDIVPPPGATPLGPPSINNVFVTCDMETPVRFELTSGVGARTIGYWKNHQAHLDQMLVHGPIDLGDTTVTNAAEAVAVLSNASAQDARNSLRAQLLATILNLRNDANPFATGPDIRPTGNAAIAYLDTHVAPVTGRHPDRAAVLAMKDLLDAFNNSGE